MNAIVPLISARKGWKPLLFLPLAVLVLIPPAWPRWLTMWLLALAIFAACKWLTLRRVSLVRVPIFLQAAYLFAWPGMDAAGFLENALHGKPPDLREWFFAFSKMLLGITIFWVVPRQVSPDEILLRGWTGMVGLTFMGHFGVFHVLSCWWRNLGRNARPLMKWPVLATSVTDFWGRRWNTAFRDLTFRFLFQPMTRIWGPRAAVLAGFGLSGLIHDLVISVPAGSGYGLPTLYFVLQGFALLGERSQVGRAMGLGHGLRGRLFSLLVVAGPTFLLFHPPFVRNIMVPFMTATGALP